MAAEKRASVLRLQSRGSCAVPEQEASGAGSGQALALAAARGAATLLAWVGWEATLRLLAAWLAPSWVCSRLGICRAARRC